jgi:hypothetical protein
MQIGRPNTIDVLNTLLQAEQDSIIGFMGDGSPYLGRAAAEVRKPLQEMVDSNHRNARELYELIDRLGGIPIERRLATQDQYLAYLSFQFLLPRLIEAMRLIVARYEGAVAALGDIADATTEIVHRHLTEHRRELAVLERAAATNSSASVASSAM